MKSKAGLAGTLDARTVYEADLVSARRRALRFVAARQQVFAKRDEPIAAAAKPYEQRDVGNIDEPDRGGFRGQLAQGSPAGCIGQDQTKQIRGALDVARTMKRAVPTRQGVYRVGAAQSGDKVGKRIEVGRIRRGKQLHSKLESR
jgi:hypothetical protein